MEAGMRYRHSMEAREGLRLVYENTARDFLAGSIFGEGPHVRDVDPEPDLGEHTDHDEAIRIIQVALDAAVAYLSRTAMANPAHTPQQRSLRIALVSALLVRQQPCFSSLLLRIHAHVLSEIGHNDDPDIIENLLRSLADISSKMRSLNMTKLTLETAHAALHTHLSDMTQYLSSSAQEEDQSSGILQDVLDYVEQRLSAYMASLDAEHHSSSANLTRPVYEVVQEHRIGNLFDLVIDFPESLPALEDLKTCIKHTRKYGVLINDFSGSITSRLLHPGASTSDIIQHYMSTIKVLKFIDPSGYILEIISKPIQRYLRSRKDSIKNIVLLLTEDDDEGDDMAVLEETTSLGYSGGTGSGSAACLFGSTGAEGPAAGLNQFYDSDAAAFASIKTWTPAPLEIADTGRSDGAGRSGRMPSASSAYRRPSNDTISLLTDIYGTKELFLSAYRSMLAEKLVHKVDFDCTKELKTLELLKIRFGEAALQTAEIMMRDVNDSKRLNAVIHGAKGGSNQNDSDFFSSLRVLVTSDQYWPSLSKDDNIDFALPDEVEAAIDIFGKRYHSQKAPRTLKWKKAIGEVSLDLTLGEQTVEFNVSPVHATILLAFETQPEYTVPDLSHKLNLPEPLLMQHAIFWINEGVMRLEKVNNVQVLRRNDEIIRPMTTIDVDDGEDRDDGVDSSMEYLQPFIVGMLTNFDALPLDRIHNMLKMFVTDPPYDRSIDDLSGLLQRMVGQGVCSYDQGGKVYRK